MNPARFTLIAIAIASAWRCTPAPSSGSIIPHSVCNLVRFVDYVGRFEVLEIAATKTASESLRSTKLRLQSTILSQAADENSRVFPEAVAVARAPEVAKIRALAPGQAFEAELTLPSGVRVGDSVIALLSYSTRFGVWADVRAQGVFFRNSSGLMENSMVYFGDSAISEASLLSEIDRGSQLARAGSSCDEGSFVALPSDAGSEPPDGGR